MSMIRFLLADSFGLSWNDVKRMPAHIVRQYVGDIERARSHFKGLRAGDARRFAESARMAGIPVS